MQIIPIDTTGLANYSQITALDGIAYVLLFQWNPRDSHWYLSTSDQDETPIQMGVRVVVGSSILRRCVDARRPPGILVAIDQSGRGLDPGFSDFGTRVELIYVTGAEVAALAAQP